ncbi:MAG: glutathione S-transferase family protein [Litoreibacter sp.]
MIRLHHSPQTRSMRSLWLLHELGVAFDVVHHAFGKNLRTEIYLKLNPAGRVPALELDDTVIFETGAITQILCERFESNLGREPDHVERSDWLIWVHFAETMSQHIAALTQQHVALYDDTMRSSIVMKLEAARLGKCYAALDRRLQARRYLLDDGFSAADISCAQAVYMGLHFVKLDPYPDVAAWYERCTQRAAFRASLPKNGEGIYALDFYEAPG